MRLYVSANTASSNIDAVRKVSETRKTSERRESERRKCQRREDRKMLQLCLYNCHCHGKRTFSTAHPKFSCNIKCRILPDHSQNVRLLPRTTLQCMPLSLSHRRSYVRGTFCSFEIMHFIINGYNMSSFPSFQRFFVSSNFSCMWLSSSSRNIFLLYTFACQFMMLVYSKR